MKKPIKKLPKTKVPVSKHLVVKLPSDNVEMENFIEKNRNKLFADVVDAIDYALTKKMKVVEVFNFDKSSFVVVISLKDFRDNLDNIFKSSLEVENYELCGKIKTIIEKMEKPSYNRQQKSIQLIKHV